MRNMIPNRKEKGFTLIELVMVIVILGILAAFALPRFADLSGDAEKASIQGAKGSLKSAMGIVHSKALASGASGVAGSPETVKLEGKDINVVYGYLAATSVKDAAQLGDFHVSTDGTVVAVANETGKPCFAFAEATVDGTTGVLTNPARVSDIGTAKGGDTTDATCSVSIP